MNYILHTTKSITCKCYIITYPFHCRAALQTCQCSCQLFQKVYSTSCHQKKSPLLVWCQFFFVVIEVLCCDIFLGWSPIHTVFIDIHFFVPNICLLIGQHVRHQREKKRNLVFLCHGISIHKNLINSNLINSKNGLT